MAIPRKKKRRARPGSGVYFRAPSTNLARWRRAAQREGRTFTAWMIRAAEAAHGQSAS